MNRIGTLFTIILLVLTNGNIVVWGPYSGEKSISADSLIAARNYDLAIEILLDSLELIQRSPERLPVNTENFYDRIAFCYFQSGKYSEAIKWFHDLLELQQKRGDLHAISTTLNNIGLSYRGRGNNDKAIEYYERAVRIDEELNRGREIAVTLNNIAMIYRDWGKYDKAIEYFERSLLIRSNLSDQEGVSTVLNNIGLIYTDWKNYNQAILNFRESLRVERQIGNRDGIATRLNNLGQVYYFQNQNDTALVYFQDALKIYLQTNNKEKIAMCNNNIGKVNVVQGKYKEATTFLTSSLDIFNGLGKKREQATVLANLSDIYRILDQIPLALQLLDSSTHIALQMNFRKQLQQNYLYYSGIYSDQQNYRKSLEYFKMYSQVKDSIFTDEIIKQLSDFQIRYETEKKENEIQLLRKNEEIQNLDLKKQKIMRNSMLVVSVLLFTIAVIVYTGLQRKKRDNLLIAGAMAKSDKLLLNILPAGIANDLKEKGKTDPQLFRDVSVCFIDIVNFSKKAAILDPVVLIDELNQIYTGFDNIIENCTCERIKTIGDSYMAVAGLPESDPGHAHNIIRSCIEMLRFIRKRNSESEHKWEVRIGVHSGEVIAGVVGVKKFIYDVFGDTINLAARLENSSEPMRINISDATYNLIKDEFEAEDRGEFEVKNMGRIRMYFVRA